MRNCQGAGRESSEGGSKSPLEPLYPEVRGSESGRVSYKPSLFASPEERRSIPSAVGTKLIERASVHEQGISPSLSSDDVLSATRNVVHGMSL